MAKIDQFAIDFPVGARPARNKLVDQIRILTLMQGLSTGDGGPPGGLSIEPRDGVESPALTSTIRHFQNFHKSRLRRPADGRVDPNGATWQLMNKLSLRNGMGVELPRQPAFAGIDVSWYTDFFMKWLADNTNLSWVGYYFPVAKYSKDPAEKLGWAGKFSDLKKMGWFGVAPIYFGMQPREARQRSFNRENVVKIGLADGAEAARMALSEGIPAGTVLFCDREGGDYIPQWNEYFWGWVQGVAQGRYSPGLYCSSHFAHVIADDMRARGIATDVWAVNISTAAGKVPTIKNPKSFPAPHPQDSGVVYATSWQFAYFVNIAWAGGQVKVDLDSSVYSDPGLRRSPFDRI